MLKVEMVTRSWSVPRQAELAAKVEKMRQSILEGLNFTRPPPFLPSPPHGMPFYPLGGSFYPPPPMMPPQRRGTVVPGEYSAVSSAGNTCSDSLVLPPSSRTRRHLITGREAGDSRHGGGPVGWNSTPPRKRRLPRAGGVCRWTEQRVSEEPQNEGETCFMLFFL